MDGIVLNFALIFIGFTFGVFMMGMLSPEDTRAWRFADKWLMFVAPVVALLLAAFAIGQRFAS